MAQFDVYRNPVAALHDTHSWVVDIQSDWPQHPVGRIGIPPARLGRGTAPAHTLTPQLDIAGEPCVLETLAISSLEPGEPQGCVANLSAKATAIGDALDFALHGY